MTSMEETQKRQAEYVARLREEYEQNIADEMGQLYNQIVVFVSAAKIPLPHIITVLDILREDALEQAKLMYRR